jgi:hypothetical protein
MASSSSLVDWLEVRRASRPDGPSSRGADPVRIGVPGPLKIAGARDLDTARAAGDVRGTAGGAPRPLDRSLQEGEGDVRTIESRRRERKEHGETDAGLR